MSAFEDFVNLELPRRPTFLTLAITSFDGDPNSGSPPAIVSGAPTGSFFLQDTGKVLWRKNTSAAGQWVLVSAPLTLAAFGAVPNASAGSVTAGVLTFQPADGANPGGISLLAQVMGAGVKEFTSVPVAPGLTAATLGGLTFLSNIADGASAVAHIANTSTAYSTPGAKLLSFRNNSVEKAYFSFDGSLNTVGALVSTATTGNSLVIDTSTLVVDAANHRVGVRNASPLFPLHVNGGSDGSAHGPLYLTGNSGTIGVGLSLDATGTGGGSIWNVFATGSGAGAGAGHLAVWDGTAYRMVLQSGGNVLIGTSATATSGELLYVNGAIGGAQGKFNSYTVDSNGATGFTLKTNNTLTGSVCKLLQINNGTIGAAYFDVNGGLNTGKWSNIQSVGQVFQPLSTQPTAITPTTATTGGTLVPGTYYYRVSAVTLAGETLPSNEVSIVVPAGTNTNTVTVTWTPVAGALNHRIYGRSIGAEQLLSCIEGLNVAASFTDTGAITPNGVLPVADTTAGFAGDFNFRGLPSPCIKGLVAGAGSLSAGTYYYRVSAINTVGETLASQEVGLTVGASASIQIIWAAVPGATGFKVYGRTTGAEQLIINAGLTQSYIDLGTITPSGALPTANTTASITTAGIISSSVVSGSNAITLIQGARLNFGGGVIAASDGFSSLNITGAISSTSVIVSGQSSGSAAFRMSTGAQFYADGGTSVKWAYDGVNYAFEGAPVNAPTGHVGYINGSGIVSNAIPTPVATSTATIAGTLGTGTYFYRVSAVNALGETLASTETSRAITGPAGVRVRPVYAPGATSYKLYGRSTGAELLIRTVAVTSGNAITGPNLDDDGSLTPSGALPTANTTNGLYSAETALSMKILSAVADGASAVAAVSDTTTPFVTAGSKLWSWRNNSVERSWVDLDGKHTGPIDSSGFLSVSQLVTPVNATHTTTTTGGSLAPGTYYYRVTATTLAGVETLASTETSIVVPAGTSTNTVTVKWTPVIGAYGYKVYGRTTGAELLMGTATGGSTSTFLDSGSITPAGALPTLNRTGKLTVGYDITTSAPSGASALTIVQGSKIALGGSTTFSFTGASTQLVSSGADGASAVAHYADTTTSYVTAGAKLFSWRNNGTEQASIGLDGTFTGPVSIVGGLAPIALANPTLLTFTTGSGTLSTATYTYTVTAFGPAGETGGAISSLAVTGPAGVNVNWTPVPGATSYKVYGRTAGLPQLIATVSGGSSNTFLDDGSITPGASNVGAPAASIYLPINARIGWGTTNATPYSGGYITSSGTVLDLRGGSIASIRMDKYQFNNTSITVAANNFIQLLANINDGASAVGNVIDNNTLLVNPGAKVLALRNANLERGFFDSNATWNGGVNAVGGLTPSQLGTPVNLTHTTATTGGSLVAATYYYRVSAYNSIGETLASTETSIVVPAGTSTNVVNVNWTGVVGATGYKIYGRTTGAELLIATVVGGSLATYQDTGSITPAGALPTTNLTGTINGVGFGVTSVPAPTSPTATLAGAGLGTLAAATYTYKISSLGQFGESLVTTATATLVVTAPQAAAGAAITVGWTAAAGATGYRIYGRTSTPLFIAAVPGQATVSFLDTGSITPVGSVPTINTTQGLNLAGLSAGAGIVLPVNTSIVCDSRATSSTPAQILFDGFKWIVTGPEGIIPNHFRVTGTANSAEWFPGVDNVLLKLGAQSGATDYISSDGISVYTGSMTQVAGVLSTGGMGVTGMLAVPVNQTHLTATTGGSLAPGTYYYRVSAINLSGETLASTETSIVVPAGTSTNTVTVRWVIPGTPTATQGQIGYRIYGRTTGAEQLLGALMGTAGSGTYTFLDDGSITPTGALPTTNTTGNFFGGFNMPETLPTPVVYKFSAGSGTLTTATTYWYRVSATNAAGETLASTEVSYLTAGTQGNNIFWYRVPGATGYKVYGRTRGAQLLIGTIASGDTLTFLDSGSVTPSGALPSTNTATGVGITLRNLFSDVADGGSAIGFKHNTTNTLANATSKLASWQNNGTEKTWLGFDGRFLTKGPISNSYSQAYTDTLAALDISPSGGGTFQFRADPAFSGGYTPAILARAGGTFAPGFKVSAWVSAENIARAAMIIDGADSTGSTLTTSPILSCQNNTVEKFAVAFNGKAIFDAGDSSGSPGAATINKPSGKAAIAIGASSVTITNSTCTAGSLVQAWVQQSSTDATLTQVIRTNPSAGSFTIVGNANATAAVTVAFLVINT